MAFDPNAPLTPEEEQELAQLEAVESSAQAGPEDDLTPEEEQELADLEKLSAMGADAPGETESFLRGAAEDITFGFADEIVAAGKATVDAIERGNLDAFEHTYKTERDEQREKNRIAEIANPKSYMAGELSGFAVTALAGGGLKLAGKALGKASAKTFTRAVPASAKKLIQKAPGKANVGGLASKFRASVTDETLSSTMGALKLGALSGGLGGLAAGAGYSEADLLEWSDNDYANLAEFGTDALLGGAAGIALGGTIGAGVSTTGKFVGKNIEAAHAEEFVEYLRDVGANADDTTRKLFDSIAKNGADAKYTKGLPGFMKYAFQTASKGLPLKSPRANALAAQIQKDLGHNVKNKIEEFISAKNDKLTHAYNLLDDTGQRLGVKDIIDETKKGLLPETGGKGSASKASKNAVDYLEGLSDWAESKGMSLDSMSFSDSRALQKHISAELDSTSWNESTQFKTRTLNALRQNIKDLTVIRGQELIDGGIVDADMVTKNFAEEINSVHNLLNAKEVFIKKNGGISFNDLTKMYDGSAAKTPIEEAVTEFHNYILEAEGIDPYEYAYNIDTKGGSQFLTALDDAMAPHMNFLKLHSEAHGSITNWQGNDFFRIATAGKGGQAAFGLPGMVASVGATLSRSAAMKASTLAGKGVHKVMSIQALQQGVVSAPRALPKLMQAPQAVLWMAEQIGIERKVSRQIAEQDLTGLKESVGMLMEHPKTAGLFEQGEGMIDENGNHVFTSEAARQSALQANKGTRSTRQRMVRQQMIEQGMIPPQEEPEPPTQLDYQFRPRNSKGRKL